MTTAKKVIAIGASTGGVEALMEVLSSLKPPIPPIVLVLHMPVGFTKLFASQLNRKIEMDVKEAQTGDFLINGQVLVAPAGKHMKVVGFRDNLKVECFAGEKVQHVIPSADVLFDSVADVVKQDAIGVILTGMGSDGARGLLNMRKSGAQTIGQNKESCTIYGMPKVAKEMGAVMYELPLNHISQKILSLLAR